MPSAHTLVLFKKSSSQQGRIQQGMQLSPACAASGWSVTKSLLRQTQLEGMGCLPSIQTRH